MIIVGLGNPGQEYEQTRHNLGWQVVDGLQQTLNGTAWKEEAGVAWSKIGDHWLLKPMEFMNRSGQSLKKFFDWKNIDYSKPEFWQNLIVVHDELDFPEVGTVKLHRNKSGAGHNGVQSIIDTFGTQDFQRLRIGIGDNRPLNIPAEDYVLQSIPATDRETIQSSVEQAINQLRELLA